MRREGMLATGLEILGYLEGWHDTRLARVHDKRGTAFRVVSLSDGQGRYRT